MSDLSVIFVGFSIVFVVMVIITLALLLFPFIFRSGKKKKAETVIEVQKTETETVVMTNEDNNDAELVAVITAAISAYKEKTGKTSNFRVASFKRVGRSK